MKHSPIISCLARAVSAVFVFWFTFGLVAAERTLNISGVNLALEDVSAQVDVYYTSMRLNRAANEWNVEVSLSNKTALSLSGPVVLLVESFTGTSGPRRADGVSSNQFFFDLTGQMPNGLLSQQTSSSMRTLALGFNAGGTPQLVTRVYAAPRVAGQAKAFTRSLNEAGQPLVGVTVEETGPAESRTNSTDSSFGVITLGQAAGIHTWKFTAPGYLPVWRRGELRSNEVLVVPYPRLTARHTNSATINPISDGMVSNETVRVQFSAGAAGNLSATLTALDGQTLPHFLPAGWSPLQAFWLELSGEPGAPADATVLGAIPSSVALVRFDPVTLSWTVLQNVVGSSNLNLSLPGSGAYVLAAPDSGTIAPPGAVVGSALPETSATAAAGAMTAGGTVDPASSPASKIPALVTAMASVTITNAAGNNPSGTLLRGEVSEHYRLQDGSTRVPPLFDSFVVAYQRPGDARGDTLHARFPLRPLLLFGGNELVEAVVRMDLSSPTAFSGGIIETNGGLVAGDGIRVLARPGDLRSAQAVQLRRIDPTNFVELAGSNTPIAAAFEIGINGIAPGKSLVLQVNDLATNATFVLARVLARDGLYGVEPRERLRSDANGTLSTDEPVSGERLPGFDGAGQYLLIQVQPQQGIVSGIARNTAGQATNGLPVRISGQPWLTFSANDGSFKLLAPAGDATVSVRDLNSGDTGVQTVTIPPALTPVSASLAAAVSGPRILAVSPASNAQAVPRVTSITVDFTKAINPATVVNHGVVLLGTNGSPVPTTLTLNLANTKATLLPSASLEAAAQYTIVVNTNIADATGRSFEGPNRFTFTTVALSARDPAAQLIIYEPGATNVPAAVLQQIPAFTPGSNKLAIVVRGTPGVADPNVPVILVNESSGETTTVLSKQDGSFASYIEGTEEDFVSATFVNMNNTRVYVPVSRQEFDNGFVGLYRKGGILEAQSDGGPVQVLIQPEAIQTRSKLKLEALTVAQLRQALGGIEPESGVVAGKAVNLRVDGPPPELPIKVRVPVNLTDLGFPTNEIPDATNVAAALAIVQNTQGIQTFEVVDQMIFTPQPPAPAPAAGPARKASQGDREQIAAGFLDTSIGLILPALGRAALPVQIGFNQILVPLLFGPRPVVIKGKVAALPYEIAVGLEQAGLINQVANLQTGSETVDIPFQLAQTMGFFDFGNVIGTAQSVINVAATVFQQQALVISKPLPGAFISVTLSGGPLVQQRGRLFPGMVYATSGADGYFLAVAPAAGANYVISASHPRFQPPPAQAVNPISLIPGQQGELSLAGAVFKNFLFTVPTETETPPTVSIATVPVQPAAGQPCQIIITASQPTAPPQIGVKILSIGTNNLLTGMVETNVQHSVSNIVETTLGNNARWIGTLTVSKPVLARFEVVVHGQNGFQDAIIPYAVGFTGPTPAAPVGDIPPPDTNDVHGPLVVETQPPNDGFVGEDGQIVFYFNKPIDAYVISNLSGIMLSGSENELTPIVRLSRNQGALTVQYPGLAANGTYRLTLSGQSVRDLAAQSLDQLPSTTNADSFTMTFRTPPAVTGELEGLDNGRGAVIRGNRLYAIEQGPPRNALAVYDISIPTQPRFINRIPLVGQPRDLAVIPQFAYKRNIHVPVVTNDIVVVVGGDLDAQINQALGTVVSVHGQYLWAIAMGEDGRSPQVIASPIVSFRVGSAVTKVRWEPPFLVYHEFGADIQLLGFVNLQEMIIGFGSDTAQRNAFPAPGRRNEDNSGKDLNGDGDYVDENETLPLPDLGPAEFYGKHQNIVLENTTQKILDFSVARGGADVGVTLKTGRALNPGSGEPDGPPLPAMYRTLVFGGLPLDIPNPINGYFRFDPGAYPRWVTLIPSLPIEVGGLRTTIAAALVSLQPDSDSTQKLAVINITVPLTPRLVSKIALPVELLGGPIQSVRLNSDGVLEVLGSRNLVQLNPSALGITNAPEGQLHPAILGLIPNAGAATRSVGTSDYGVHAVVDGDRSVVVQSPPSMLFVSFPSHPSLLLPAFLNAEGDANLNKLFSGVRPAFNLAPAKVRPEPTVFVNSDLEPQPNVALHYYVLVTAPGGAGRTIELGLESLNPAGRPLSNPGAGFAPVRSVAESTQDAIGQRPRESCGATIRSLPAWRMSDDPHSPFYNRYLSRPFALVTETVTSDELFRLRNQVDREIIFSGAALRAFIEPGQATHPDAGPVIGGFAAQIDSRKKLIFPISSASAGTVNRDYIVGDNPPPSGGTSPLEDTYGAIQAHSGEVRTMDIDLSLPSPRMPISIFRTIGNQDTYEGPFGVGWDFNYNQRLTVLDPLTFPEGLQLPLVVRDSKEASDIAGSQDVLFNDGEGRVLHFRWSGTNMPPEYAKDPLVLEFKYEEVVSDYYLPQRGMFNLLVKFKDGRFERLTPAGMRYRYSAEGRLETIIDSYPLNRHELQYDRNGWLVRIDDRSVTADRYVEVGHFRRRDSDPDFKTGLDENTANSFLEGLICRLRDYTGRDILFEYDAQGFLTRRQDITVNGENGGFSGRAQTFYKYKECRLVSISATANGTPYISAATMTSDSGKPVAQSSSGNYGNAQISVEVNNSAKTVGDQTSAVEVGDGTKVERKFDNRGNVTTTTVSGPGTPPATQVKSNTADGLVAFIKNPEGNTQTMTYDSENPILRSRGNLLSINMDPGSRGGFGYTKTFHYDPRYNIQSGEQRDANGFAINYGLTSDGRAVGTVDYGGGTRRTAIFDTHGQVTHSVDENGVEVSVDYAGATGFIQSQTYGDITYTYGYDGSVASQLGRPASIAPPLSAATTLSYNSQLQPVQVSRGALVKKTTYDEIGRAIRSVQDVGDGKQLTTSRGYDQNGFVTNSAVSGVEVNGVVSSITTTMVPDKRSRIDKVIHPNGTEQKFTYDARGNTTKVTFGEYTEEFSYDLNNNLVSAKQGGDVVRTYTYDGLDRAKEIVRKTGTQDYLQTRVFYPGGEIQSETGVDPVFGTVMHSTYDSIDALGRHLKVGVHGNAISPEYTYAYRVRANEVIGPRMTSTTTWDTAGNTDTYTDPNLRTVIHRDGNGRAFQLDSIEEGATYTQTYTFDDLDHHKSLSDLLGTRFNYEPRADGNYTKITNLRGNSATMEHTALGELQRKRRADGMEMQYRRDAQRQLLYQGDPGAGFAYSYDASLRMDSSKLRNGATMTYEGFDPRSMPSAITIPGGSETRKHDLQRRVTQHKVTYQSRTLEHNFTYDAMDRIRAVTYVQNGGANNSASFDYDPAGPLLAAHFREDGDEFNVTYGYYADGTRRSITYPSGAVVTEVRDTTGRLTGLSGTNGNIVSAVSWQGNSEPKILQIGSAMQIVNQYDVRGRMTGSRVTRTSDGTVLAHMRYQYDAANNIQIRQFLHRGGKADVFGFDSGERVTKAQVGVLVTNVAGFGPALYGRDYNYHTVGLDYLTTVTLSGTAPRAPPFATNWTDHDSFLLPRIVDGFVRGSADPKGNVASARLWVRPAGGNAPQSVSANLQHDGLGRLTHVTRADGVTIEHQYQLGGLRFSTKVSQGGSVLRHSAFVYDSSARLIEEFDRSVTPSRVIARYFYGSGDAPMAADLYDSGSGQLRRYYYLTDVSMSVVAVVDATGNVVERVWYDTFGQPHIERRDTAAPAVNRIQAGTAGSLLLALSESIQPPSSDPGLGSSIVAITTVFDGAITLRDASNAPIAGVLSWETALPGFEPFSVLRFTPSQTATGSVTLTLTGGAVSDEWGNTNAARTFTFTNSQPAGTIYYQASPQSDTAPVSLARSDVNSPVLFHGQYFDYESGLHYLRARFYDPYSGMFFQPDPLGYEDSVNHYAGLGNNPVSFRDPSGLHIKGFTFSGFHTFLHNNGYNGAELRLLARVHGQLTRLGMGDLEIAAHVRVMYQQHRDHGRNWEIAIRSFGDKAQTRIDRIDEFHQTKEEKVYAKTQDDGLARHEEGGKATGEVFAGDLDGLYAKINGDIATIGQLHEFQTAVNAEVARLSGDYRKMAEKGGQTIHGTDIQKAYQHGFSLNIPQEYGSQHALSDGGRFGFQAVENINKKMKKGIGEAFSFTFDPEGIQVEKHVDVDGALREHEDHYQNVLFNPAMMGRGFNPQLYHQREQQIRRDGRAHETFYPKPFYFQNN